MKKRKQIDGSELTVDMAEQIPQGDMSHPVWATAYAYAYAKIFGDNSTHDEEASRAQWHTPVARAQEAADLAYFSFTAIGGNEVPGTSPKTNGEKKEYPEGEPYKWGEVEVAKETEKALKVKSPGTDDDGEWVPKSQIHSKSEVKGDGDEGILMVTQWFADQKNLTENGQAKEDEIPF
jgi:hypothetical protein